MSKSFNRYTLPVIALTTGACQPDESAKNLSSESTGNTMNQSFVSNKITPTSPISFNRQKKSNITFHVVAFDSRIHELNVVDQSRGLGSEWADAKSAAKAHSALAAINAGFFTPDEKPLGLVIENSKTFGSFNRSSLGAGIFYVAGNDSAIVRSSQWDKIKSTNPSYLLQSGPFLVEHGSSTKGLSSTSSRVRSFIAWDGKHHWGIGHASSCTLSELGETLSQITLNGSPIKSALNLDGGRSSDLWVSSSITGTSRDLIIRPFWNKPVRNFLILKTK